jgi:hypothetical protein
VISMERWICCGHDIMELCRKAGCTFPTVCFFCGEPRKTVTLSPQPEDWLAFELAELWSGKIREFHGDPETHVPSLDEYGRTDVEAWRAVARRAIGRGATSIAPDREPIGEIDPLPQELMRSPEKLPDPQATRDELVRAIQDYAEEWEAGKVTIHSDGKTNLCIALDRHEFEVRDKAILDLKNKGLAKGK